MQVVKLSNSGRPSKEHLEESHSSYIEYLVRSELSSGVVHRSAPTPEISATRNPGFRLPPNQTLEGVRMCVDEARQECLPREVDGPKTSAISLSEYALDSSGIIDEKSSIRNKRAVKIQQLRTIERAHETSSCDAV
jgi:hypothetical protein